MVGKCVCGRFKFNLHNHSLTEIPWLCYECRDLTTGIKNLVQTSVARQSRRMAPSVIPKQKPPIMFSIKRISAIA